MSSKRFDTDPARWQKPTPEEMLGYLEDPNRRRSPLVWVNDGRLSPLELYCYLKSRFGPPNGFSMMFRVPDSNNLIHWQYTLCTTTGFFIDIFGLNRRTEIIIHGLDTVDDLFWTTLVNRFHDAIFKTSTKWKPTLESLEKWHLFINPYKRLRIMATDVQHRLSKLDLTAPNALPHLPTRREADVYSVAFRRWLDATSEARLLGTTLRMLAPVLGEALINMLFFLLAKEEVKADQRLYEDFVRKQIDVRIRGLALYCVGFGKPLDAQDKRFKAFHSVMNARNDFLYGNVDPKRMRIGDVFFDDYVPLFKDEKRLIERWIENSLNGVERNLALADLAAVEAILPRALRREPEALGWGWGRNSPRYCLPPIVG